MIVQFSVGNFRSFLNEETISFVASNRLSGSHDNHTVTIPDSEYKLLRTAAIYGANGAGKSNIVKAIRYFKSLALRTRNNDTGTGRSRFKFNSNEEIPSTFDLRFIVSDNMYRLGFKVDDYSILEEWLVLERNGKEKIIYERITEKDGKVVVNIMKKIKEKMKALAIIGGPKNQSFLATIIATLDKSDVHNEILSIAEWLKNGLVLVDPRSQVNSLTAMLSRDTQFRDFASDFLRMSSTGVERINVTKRRVDESDLQIILPKSILPNVMNDLTEENKEAAIQYSDGREIIVERGESNDYFITSIGALHKDKSGNDVELELKEESDGTRRLLDLLPALYHMKNRDIVYFIDEIDRSIHPILVKKFIEFFLKSCENGNRQVIFTTHESNLLDLDLLRRDEIWFAEKDSFSATKLYSLADFNVRKDLEIRKNYMQGRFGAIPFLGSIDTLL